ncbi:MAG: hypothetical protein QGG53_16700 [Planctomycetota bacterium]|nr:hypothetical protein [Planctomycetota bacterium]
MRVLKPVTLLFLFTDLCTPTNAEELRKGKVSFELLQTVSAREYSVEITASHKRNKKFRELIFLFGLHGNSDYYRLKLTKTKAILERCRDDEVEKTWQGRGRFLHGDSKQPHQLIEIRRHTTWITVVVNHAIALRILEQQRGLGAPRQDFVPASAGGKVYVRAQDDLDITRLRVQPLEPIILSDDFMKTAETAEDLGLWKPDSGLWKIQSIDAKVRSTGLKISSGKAPDSQRSPNPFSLSSAGEEPSIITAGYRFWSDYSTEVSSKTEGGWFGVVVGWRCAKDYFLFRAHLQYPKKHAGTLQLLRVQNGETDILDERHFLGRTGDWYRLRVSAVGGRIRASMDDTLVFDFYDRGCSGGKIGLYSEGAGTVFDDAVVRSDTAIYLNRKEDVRKLGTAALGQWKVVEGKKGLTLECRRGHVRKNAKEQASKPGLFDLWNSDLTGLRFEADLDISNGRAAGLGIFLRDGRDHLKGINLPGPDRFIRSVHRFASSGDDSVGRTSYCVTSEGRFELQTFSNWMPHPDVSFPIQAGKRLHLALDFNPGQSGFFVNGVKVSHLYDVKGPTMGRLFLYADEGAVFSNIVINGKARRDWSQNVSRDIFVDDPYMQGWASPKWAWRPAKIPDDSNQPATWLYRGDCYGAVHLSIPIQESTWFWGSKSADDQSGRGVRIARKDKESFEVSILDKGKVGKSFVIPGSDAAHVEVFSSGYCTWIRHNEERADFRHDTLPSGILLGILAPMSFDFSSVEVRRDHVQDYLFENAAIDWSRIGTWEVTNRFACDPRWSHMNGRSTGLASFWNKHRFTGDFTIEAYAGMRMRHGELLQGFHQWYNYPRVGDINFSFCADGRDVFSGYTMVVTEWDPDWSEKYSRLYRQRQKVAETDQQLIPSVRIKQTDERAIPIVWDPGGRAIHGAWYHLKLRRRGKLIEYFFDNRKVLEFEDDSPIDAGRIAVWTQNNSIVVARTQIAYERCVHEKLELVHKPRKKKSAPLKTSEPEFLIHSLTHPYHRSNFEKGLQGWQPIHKDQSALLTVDATNRAEGKHSLRFENMHGGGDFGAVIPVLRGDLSRVQELSFHYRIPESAKVNLYFDLEGHPYRTFFIRLTGHDESSIAMTRLGDFKAVADGEWHRAVFPLGRSIRAAMPSEVHHIVHSMKIGNFHEGYLNAGLGGNQAGLVYHIDDFRMTSAGPEAASFEFEPEDPNAIKEFVWTIDKNPVTKSLKPGAKVKTSKVQTETTKIKVDVKKTGKTPRSTKPVLENARPPRHIARATEKLGHGNWYLHVQGIRCDGSKTGIIHRQVGVEMQTRVVQLSPKPDAAWGGEPIRLQFREETTAAPILETMQLFMKGEQIPLGDPVSNYDAYTRALTLTLNHLEQTCEPDQPVPFELKFEGSLKHAPEIPLDPNPNKRQLTFWFRRPKPIKKKPRQADDASKLISYKWTYTFATSADKTPPSRVRLAGRLLDLDFEENLGGITASDSVQGAILKRDSSTAADGTRSLKFTNPAFGSSVSSVFFNKSYNLGAYPIFSFDYRTEGKLRMNFYTQASGSGRYIRFTDPEGGSSVYGLDFGLKMDGEWHHAEMNLREAFNQRLGSSFNHRHFEAQVLSLADYGHRANLAGESLHIDNVTMTPAISTKNEVALTWNALDLGGVKGFAYKWSQTPSDEPSARITTVENTATFRDLPEGDNWFHIRAVDAAGNWGPARHYRYIIDNTPPNIASALPANGAKSTSSYVAVRLRDKGVGVNPMNLGLSLNGQPITLQSSHARMLASGDLRYNWAQAKAPMVAPIPNGTAMNYEIKPFSDFVGNQSAGRTWIWNIDYSRDKNGPSTLTVSSPSAQMLSYSDFSASYGSWSGSNPSLYLDPERNDRCLKVTINAPLYKSALSHSKSFYSHRHHILTFDYRFPPGLTLMLKLYASDKHNYIIGLTGESDIHENIAVAEGIIADGKWRRAIIDLQAIIKAAYPDVSYWSVRSLSFGNWSRGSPNPKGTTYYLDNIAIQGSGSPAPIFSWSTWDVTGISGFSYTLDRQPATEPDDSIDGSEIQKTFAVLEKPGFSYFHVKARDGAGNWSRTSHYPYYSTSIPPEVPSDGYEKSREWQAVVETQGAAVTAQPVKTINGKNSLLSVDWQPSKKSRYSYTRFMHPVKGLSGKTQITFRAFHQGKHAVSLYPLLETSEGDIFYGRAFAVTKGTWETVHTVSLGTSSYRTSTKKRPIPALDLSKVTHFGFRIYNYRSAGSMLLESVEVN